MRDAVNSPKVSSSPLYSQAVRAGGFVFTSGLIGNDLASEALAGPSIGEQTRQALKNCQSVLEAAGADLDDVVEVGVLLADAADFAGMNTEYLTWFRGELPARYVAKLGVAIPGVLVSIRMTAHQR